MASSSGFQSIMRYIFASLLLFGALAALLHSLDRAFPPSLSQPEYAQLVVDAKGEHLRRYTTSEGYWR